MRVAVVGGTGTVGALVVEELLRRGHQVRVLSRRPPAGRRPIEYRRVDLASGAGLPEALSGIEVVVDASNALRTGRGMEEVLVRGAMRLLAAETEVGVRHHILISIVGIDALRVPYYAGKRAQERVVHEGPVTASVLRSTQFHQLLARLFAASARFGLLPGGRIPLQPVDADEVAVALVGHLEKGPWSGRREIAGPEIVPLQQLARSWLAVTGRRRLLVPLPTFGATGRALRAGALTSSEASRGTLKFARWLQEGGAPSRSVAQ
jgi:uncharacterized protein YbjT (DUF2867 family)